MRQGFSYASPQTRAGYGFHVRRTPVRYAFSNAQADLRARVTHKFRVRRSAYIFTYPGTGGRGRYRFRCGFYGEILRELPPPPFMMPVHEPLYENFYAALMPPEREALRGILTQYPSLLPRNHETLNTGDDAWADLPDFRSADNPEIYRQAGPQTHSVIFDASDRTLDCEYLSVLTAAAALLSTLEKEIESDNEAAPLGFYDNRDIICGDTGGVKLESVVPEALAAAAEGLLKPIDLREGSFYAEPIPLAGETGKNALAQYAAAALAPGRKTEAEYGPQGDEELERITEHSLTVAVLYLLCREIFQQSITESETYGVRLKVTDALRDTPETGFAKTPKDSVGESLQAQAEKEGKDTSAEKLFEFLDKLTNKFIIVSHDSAAQSMPHKSVLVKALLKALEKAEKTGVSTPTSRELLREPEKAALLDRISRHPDRFTKRETQTDESLHTALREYFKIAQNVTPEQTADKLRHREFLSEKTMRLAAMRLRGALMSAERLLTAAHMGFVDLKNERELALWSRFWFIRGEGDCDSIILPAHDFDYSGSPITFEGFDDLIPENYGVVYPETFRRGVLEHPIPEGAQLAAREIPVAISVMTELISVLILMWSRFYRAFWGWTGVQAVLGITHETYAWLTLESSRARQDERGSREHYDRCYRWLRWEAEKTILYARNDMELRGNYYVGLLIEELIGYMTDHHFDIMPIFEDVSKMDQWRGLFGREAESDLVWTLDKVKGTRHKIITQKGRKNV